MVVQADCQSLVQRCRALCLSAVQRRFYGPAERFFARWRAVESSEAKAPLATAESAAAEAAGATVAAAAAAWPSDHFAGDVASHLMLVGALTAVLLLRRGLFAVWGGAWATGALETVVLGLFVADEAADIVFAGVAPGVGSLLQVLERGCRDYFAIPG